VLSLFDTTNLIVGIIVGAGIFVAAPVVARGAGSAVALLALWFVGGLLSFCGAASYAELATTYPEQGGDLVYLTRAYGRWAGFLFGWLQTLIVRPGDIAVMAFVFATYAENLTGPRWVGKPAIAAIAVAVLTAVNVAGVRSGVRTQNVLTVAKIIGVFLVIIVAIFAPGAEATSGDSQAPIETVPLAVALILVLFSFGGWNGMAGVTVIYLAVNLSFLRVLGFGGLATSEAVAADTVASVFPEVAGSFVSALICLCALGAVNGLIFAGARIAYALGRDHRLFSALGTWSKRTGTPVRALILQGCLAIILILVLGSFVDTVMYTAAAVYLFYLATSVALIVLRIRDRSTPRPYKATGFPVSTTVFCLVCLFLIVAAVQYKPTIAVVAGLLILLGVPAFWLSERARN
jgi:amino acid transporter